MVRMSSAYLLDRGRWRIFPQPYVPLLRWRQGEYEALFRLRDPQKNATLPLIEIVPPDYDFELRKPKKDLDEHLKLFGKRLGAKWKGRPAFIDAARLDPDNARMPDGRHPLTFIFDEARTAGNPLIPLTGLDRDAAYQAAVRGTALIDGRGADAALLARTKRSIRILTTM